MYFAAWSSPDQAAAALAATWALRTAKHAFYECHQLHGAIGFTNEYPLHRWTLRLKALGVEAGGFAAASTAACGLALARVE
jgi:alkylation response protein AidB-like acyl-CoA dehydrogenase